MSSKNRTIYGTIKEHRLEENLNAAKIEFTLPEMVEMELTSSRIEIMGDRFTDKMESATGL